MAQGLRSKRGLACPPYSKGPFTWDQQVTFSAGVAGVNAEGSVWFVDGTNGSSGNDGMSWDSAMDTIQGAVDKAGAGDTVFVTSQLITDFTGDPTSYTENVIIGADTPNLSLIGVSRGQTQGGLPQLKVGDTTTSPLLTIQAAGCLIANMGFNGAGATGGGILLDDDYATKTAFGTTIVGCHFKNCKGTTATNAATGGAINWGTAGNAWQVRIADNVFYKNVGDIVLKGTSNTVPQDVVIEGNVFSGPAANVDCNLYLAGGSGINGVIIRNNEFTSLPNVGSGTNATAIVLTGCTGVLFGNRFAGATQTFGAAGNNLVPTTVFMCDNYQEDGVTQILRT